jgi:glutamate synthase domain-containing protein 2
MSFGSLSAAAVEALNKGAKLANCLQNTGEGGISPAHLHGGDLIWQIGTGYFGCRDEKGGFSRVQRILTGQGVHQQIVFVGSGKLGVPEATVFAFALGCDMVNVGREAMLAIGCIQAQRCHTNHCPTGVATQHPWLVRGVDPTLKAARLANYIVTLRKDVLALRRACGVPHPALITPITSNCSTIASARSRWPNTSATDAASACRRTSTAPKSGS